MGDQDVEEGPLLQANDDDVNNFLPDYVITYNTSESSDQGEYMVKSVVIDILKDKIKSKLNLDLRIIESEVDKTLRYIAIKAPRSVLTQRAELNKTSIPSEYKISDLIIEGPWGPWPFHMFDCTGHRLHQRIFKRVTAKLKKTKFYIADFFTPNLQSGYIKIEYDRKYDPYFLDDSKKDPFELSRIRTNLVHDLIQDIDISYEISILNSSIDTQDRKYRGVEWMKRCGYITGTFVPHHEADRQRSKKMAKEKGWVMSVTSLREYLGEKVGFSFAWRSAWLSNGLAFPMIAGFIVFIYGLCTASTRNNEFEKGENHTYNNMSDQRKEIATSLYSQIFDTPALPYYAIIFNCTLPIIMFTYMWARFKYIYGFKWGVLNYFLYNERKVLNYSTLENDDSIEHGGTSAKKVLFKLGSLILATFLLLLCAGYNFCTILVQQLFKEFLRRHDWSPNAAFILSQSSISFVNCILVVLVINRLFARLSYWLTKKELHFFPSDFERSLTWRIFFYSFVNNNMRLFMILFFPRFGIGAIFEGQIIEFCEEGKCLESAFYQLGAFLFVKPLAGMLGFIYHYVKYSLCCLLHPELNKTDTLAARLDKENSLYSSTRFENAERYQTLWDMNNRVAQYGFVIMFGAVFPLAPLLAFCIELALRKADINRYLYRQTRPVPRRHESVGSWEEIVDFVNMIGIITNVWIISFRSRYGMDFIFDWNELCGEDGRAMLAFVLISSICILKFGLMAVGQFYSVPECVKRFHRLEADRAERFLRDEVEGRKLK